MQAKTKGKHPVVSGFVPNHVLADLVEGSPRPVPPEIAAERAASRIIQAVTDGEKKDFKERDDA